VRPGWVQGAGVRSISPLYSAGDACRRHQCAGLVLGYASLEPEAIEEDPHRMASVLRNCAPGRTPQKNQRFGLSRRTLRSLDSGRGAED
jgi:hypothetical protein